MCGRRARAASLANFHSPGFLAFLDTAVSEGFLRAADRDRLHRHADPEGLLDALQAAVLEPA